MTWTDTSHANPVHTERQETVVADLKVVIFRPCLCLPPVKHRCMTSDWYWTVSNDEFHATSQIGFASENAVKKVAIEFARKISDG